MSHAEANQDPLSAESLMADVRLITELGWRRNGSPAARNAAAHFRREFERASLTTTVESWPFNLYYPQEWSVSAHPTGQPPANVWRANSLPIWYSTPGAARGGVVYVDARTGSPSFEGMDLAGKVVLADISYAGNFLPSDGSSSSERGLYATAVAAGAVGYVRRAGAPGNATMLMHFAQNFPTHAHDARLGQIPAFTVGQVDFDRLAREAAIGSEIELHNVLLDVPKGGWATAVGGSLGPGEHALHAVVDDVIGILPGKSDDVVIIASHYDSTFDGAVDNATGNAVLLGLMRHYTALPLAERPRTLVFLASGGHDTGDFDLYHFVERHRDDLLQRTIAFNWLDHMAADGSCTPPGNTVVHGVIASENEELRDQIRTHMSAFGIPVAPLIGPASTISHLPPYVPSYNVTLAPSWYHSAEDTIATVPAEQLAVMATAQRVLIDALMRTDVRPRAATGTTGDS